MLIQKYTSNWIIDFVSLQGEIAKALNGLDFTIEHVGSTAVPNLDAKAIIDIDIIYHQKADFEQILISALAVAFKNETNLLFVYTLEDYWKRFPLTLKKSNAL